MSVTLEPMDAGGTTEGEGIGDGDTDGDGETEGDGDGDTDGDGLGDGETEGDGLGDGDGCGFLLPKASTAIEPLAALVEKAPVSED